MENVGKQFYIKFKGVGPHLTFAKTENVRIAKWLIVSTNQANSIETLSTTFFIIGY